MHHTLDETASSLISALAGGIPLTLRPYADLGARVGLPEAEVLTMLRDLRARRVLARVGASFSPAALGYHAALGGLAVREEGVEAAAAHLAALPGVTHVFEIEDRYRLWYAIVVPSRVRLELAEAEIAASVGAADRYRVLADEVFKVTATFDADGAPEASDPLGVEPMRPLDRDEKALVRLLLGELPQVRRPFSDLAITLGECGYDIDERWALDRTQALAAGGAVRAIEATMRTRAEPFRVALTVWLCPTDTEASGEVIASFPEVVHCFARRVPGGGMAVLALVEIADRPALDRAIERIRVATDLDAPRVLYPVQEFKRSAMRYFSEGE